MPSEVSKNIDCFLEIYFLNSAGFLTPLELDLRTHIPTMKYIHIDMYVSGQTFTGSLSFWNSLTSEIDFPLGGA
jgi:hypothetical protein